MKKHKALFTVILLITLIGCGKTDKNEENTHIDNTEKKDNTTESNSQKEKTSFKTPTDSIRAVKESVLRKQNYKKKVGDLPEEEAKKTETNTTPTKVAVKQITVPSFVYLKKILDNCKIGEPMTQKDLKNKFNIPEEAMKLVKSVTKTGPNELDIKWKSTWLVEKISDAKFKDGKLKMRFEKNKMYTSGGAISIKYEKKLYSDLILVGRSAYIPSVKGYHWQIGKDK